MARAMVPQWGMGAGTRAAPPRAAGQSFEIVCFTIADRLDGQIVDEYLLEYDAANLTCRA